MPTNDEIIDNTKVDYDSFFRYSRTKLNDMLNEARADEREKVLNEFEHMLIQQTILNENRKLKSGSYDLMHSYKSGFREAIKNLRRDIAIYQQTLKNALDKKDPLDDLFIDKRGGLNGNKRK